MSKRAKQLFDGMSAVKDAVHAAVPSLKNAVPDLKSEMTRMATQGAMEIAAVLFGGNGFVQYGPGQSPTSQTHEHSEHEASHAAANDGMER